MATFAKVLELCKIYPKGLQDHRYGTAGFRARNDTLDHVVFRMGILAAFRSKVKKAAIGLMITASHNPENDNGIKLIDPHGEMLESSWEEIATDIANCECENLPSVLENLVISQNIDMTQKSVVVLGRDTRSSGRRLSDAAKQGVSSVDGTVNDFEEVTTPILHYIVRCINTNGEYGSPTVQGYFTKLVYAFSEIHKRKSSEIECRNILGLTAPAQNNYEPEVYLDGANGIGALKMKELSHMLGNVLRITVFNGCTENFSLLNNECGADFVKVMQKPPANSPVTPDVRCASVDGDSDRLVYYYLDFEKKFHLLDGDRIASLIASYFAEIKKFLDPEFNIGVVQTAYANGNSTRYIAETLGVPVSFVETGVKYLHKRALEYSIGIYFEANGHGTVLFDEKFKLYVEHVKEVEPPGFRKYLFTQLSAFIKMVNETVGDALSDLLIVETILKAKGWSIQDWEAQYDDLPNRQLKITVKDRHVIRTTDAERRVVTPEQLQPAIDVEVKKYPSGRAFARPSGTEDIVRVYAEANNRENADTLAMAVAKLVYNLAGGVGHLPSL